MMESRDSSSMLYDIDEFSDPSVLYAAWPDADPRELDNLRESFLTFDRDKDTKPSGDLDSDPLPTQSGAIDIGELQYIVAAQMTPEQKASDFGNATVKIPTPCVHSSHSRYACQALWNMMEQMDTQMPHGTIGLAEWIEYYLNHHHLEFVPRYSSLSLP